MFKEGLLRFCFNVLFEYPASSHVSILGDFLFEGTKKTDE